MKKSAIDCKRMKNYLACKELLRNNAINHSCTLADTVVPTDGLYDIGLEGGSVFWVSDKVRHKPVCSATETC